MGGEQAGGAPAGVQSGGNRRADVAAECVGDEHDRGADVRPSLQEDSDVRMDPSVRKDDDRVAGPERQQLVSVVGARRA